ncbi:MAG: hypothetical protein BroJett024_41420 [Alphaproteobacteria bacterium]|nr:MAG: hypothetical protein BroJett024_41420 [Alphaproteobacteria bacterium]
MSLHEEIGAAIQREIDSMGDAIALSPTSLALAVQRSFDAASIEPHIAYTSLEHLKQMARRVLARNFDTTGEDGDARELQGEMFAGQLQDRYPVPRAGAAEPIYKRRDALTRSELEWNIRQLRKSAAARLEHADALQAWADERRQNAA